MSDEIDWDFSGPDDAKAEIRAAVGYLLKDAAGSDCGDIVREIIAIVNEAARGLPPGGGQDPLDDVCPVARRADRSPRRNRPRPPVF
jgi:hypothetical protein